MSLARSEEPPADLEPRFRDRVDALGERYVAMWHSCPIEPPVLGPRVPRRRQRRNARATERLIGALGDRIEGWPDDKEERQRWRRDTRTLVQRWGEQTFGWPVAYRVLLFDDGFLAASAEFARRSRRFDPDLPTADLCQALRNVWIGNSIQMLLDLELGCPPALFAYSMLYPYTDNFLDDPEVSHATKQRLNRGLARRLAGEAALAHDAREATIFRMVDEIESQYPRSRHLEVYLSLLAIHRAQERSLAQRRALGDDELLAITVAKGGASVLADGYLVAGEPSPSENEFFFGFGVFLQLLDDLQDVDTDLEVGHETLFSRATRTGPLDELASRVVHLVDRVLDSTPRFAAPEYDLRKDLIRRNCVALLAGSVAESPQRFTPSFVRELERRWPLRFAAMRKLRVRARRELERRRRVVERRGGAAAILEQLADA